VSEYVRCVGCGEIVEATEPCSCLFDVIGTLDAQGVLHTAERVPVQFAVPCCCCEQIFEPDPQQVEDWGQSGRRFEPTDWVCQACKDAEEADLERLCEIEERAWLETERAAEWAVQQHVSQYGNQVFEYGPVVCYECGNPGASMRECYDGEKRMLCTDCWWYLYRH
jgi:hypothetical protein